MSLLTTSNERMDALERAIDDNLAAIDGWLNSPEWITPACEELKARGYKRINDPRQERST